MSEKIQSDDFVSCPTCGVRYFDSEYSRKYSPHRCKPVFRVREDDRFSSDEDFREVRADDPEEAAEKYCEEVDAEIEYSILREGSTACIVEQDDKRWRVEISAESVPTYYGSDPEEIEPAESKQP